MAHNSNGRRSPEAELYRKWYSTSRWRKLRKAFLADNPLCLMCQEQGKLTPATVADHTKAHKGDSLLFWDASNLTPLCAIHHDSTKQAQERGSERRLIGVDGWPISSAGA